ncbi:hypothetical protein PHISP_08747 [Aspergillus sp. HF37]|nr:hypothetical protein PHISP_08747 [Aspergillus sp. HF37]
MPQVVGTVAGHFFRPLTRKTDELTCSVNSLLKYIRCLWLIDKVFAKCINESDPVNRLKMKS